LADDLQRIPRKRDDDLSPEALKLRQDFVEAQTGTKLDHLTKMSWDPHLAEGNTEQLLGVAQIPVGVAGPLLIDGEYAQGEFYVPLATSEGTLVASYNRGMRLLSLSGGARTTVQEDCMQRAPVFAFAGAREARDFSHWVMKQLTHLATAAETTTSIGKLLNIEPYLANNFAFLRFNFSTGDAAGQNMVGRATEAACEWIRDNYQKLPGSHTIKHFYLESNFATDKKASHVNMLMTRGKRVTAEALISGELLRKYTRADVDTLVMYNSVGNIGAMMSGATNNGLHSANGIAALFIATGQDVANVAESSAAIVYSEVTPEKDLYISITIPALIVATHGGGTGLPTPQECLSMLGCTGPGTVKKFAEIVAATVLAGEISLAAAIAVSDWVSSHEQYGRNR